MHYYIINHISETCFRENCLFLAPTKPTSIILIILTLKQFGVHEFVALQQRLERKFPHRTGLIANACRQETGAIDLDLCGADAKTIENQVKPM